MDKERRDDKPHNHVHEAYRRWLLTKVLIECWTTRKCAAELARNEELVERDLARFLEEEEDSIVNPGTNW